MFKNIGLFLCFLAVSRGVPLNDAQPDNSGDGPNALIKFYGLEKEMLPPTHCTADKIVVKYYLYTRESPLHHEIDPNNEETLKNSSFNVKDETKIVIHDWLQSQNYSYNRDFASAFLKNKYARVNVITVDYGSVSQCEFATMVNMQPTIGQKVGKLVKLLYKYGTVVMKMHLIGLGMGSHIAGYAAREIHPKRIARLTALNPTFLGLNEKDPQIRTTDSDYMDVIHTAQRQSGSVLGDARFFPNGGVSQKLSDSNDNHLFTSEDSHLASALYYLQSIVYPTSFKAQLCSSYIAYLQHRCGEPAVYSYMGEEADISRSGDFYLKLDKTVPPFISSSIDVIVYEPRRRMEVKVKAMKEISDAEVSVGKQTYETKRLLVIAYSDEDIKKLTTLYSSKTP